MALIEYSRRQPGGVGEFRGFEVSKGETFAKNFAQGVSSVPTLDNIKLGMADVVDKLMDERQLHPVQLEKMYPGVKFEKPMTPTVAAYYAKNKTEESALARYNQIAQNSTTPIGNMAAQFGGNLLGATVGDPLSYIAPSIIGGVTRGRKIGKLSQGMLDMSKGAFSPAAEAVKDALRIAPITAASNITYAYQNQELTGGANYPLVFTNMAMDIFGSAAGGFLASRNILSTVAKGDVARSASVLGVSEDSLKSISGVMLNETMDDVTKIRLSNAILRNDPKFKRGVEFLNKVDDIYYKAHDLASEKGFTFTSMFQEAEAHFKQPIKDILSSSHFDDVPNVGAQKQRVKKYTAEALYNKRIDPAQEPALRQVSEFTQSVLGRELVVVPDKVAREAGFMGRVSVTDMGKIFVAESAIKGGKVFNITPVALLGHEFYHTLKGHNPQLVKDLVKVMEELPDEVLGKLVQKWGGPRNPKIMRGHSKYWEEFMADMAGDAFDTPEFWTKLLKHKNPQIKQLASGFLSDMKAQGALQGDAFFAKEMGVLIRQARRRPKAEKAWKDFVAKVNEGTAQYNDVLDNYYTTLDQKLKAYDQAPLPGVSKQSNIQKAMTRLIQKAEELRVNRDIEKFIPSFRKAGAYLNLSSLDPEKLPEVLVNMRAEQIPEDIVKFYEKSFSSFNKSKNLIERHLAATPVGSLPALYHKLVRDVKDPEIAEAAMRAYKEVQSTGGDLDTILGKTLSPYLNMSIRRKYFNSRGLARMEQMTTFQRLVNGLVGDPADYSKGAGNNVSKIKETGVTEILGPLTAVLQKYGINKAFTKRGGDPVVEDIFKYLRGAFDSTDAAYGKMIKDVGDVLKQLQLVQEEELIAYGLLAGKASDFIISVKHNGSAIKKAGEAEWVAQTKQLLDLDRTYDRIAHLNERELPSEEFLNEYLKKAYHGLKDEVLQDLEEFVPQDGQSVTVWHRKFVFREGGEYAYDSLYGTGNPGQNLLNTLTSRAEQIALAKTLGTDIASLRNKIKATGLSDTEELRALAIFDQVTGTLNNPVNRTLGDVFNVVNRLTDMAVLGKSAITSLFGDPITMAESMKWLGAPAKDAYLETSKAIFNAVKRKYKGDKANDYFTGLNVGTQALTGAMAKRLGGAFGGYGAVASLHNSFFNWNGLGLVTSVYHEAMFDVAQQHIAKSIKDFVVSGTRNEQLMRVFDRMNIKPDDLPALHNVIAKHDGLEGIRINPLDVDDKVLRGKLTRLYNDVLKHGVLEPDEASTAYATLGLQAGTPMGVAARTVTKYLSFEIAMLRQVYRRMASIYTAGGVTDYSKTMAHVGMFAVGAYMTTAVASGVKDLVDGKEPRFDDDRLFELITRSGILPVLPTLLQTTNLDNVLGLDKGDYGFLGPATSKITQLTQSRNSYKAIDSVMGMIPFNNLPIISEGKQLIMANLFNDWYGTGYQRSLSYMDNRYGQASIFLDEDGLYKKERK